MHWYVQFGTGQFQAGKAYQRQETMRGKNTVWSCSPTMLQLWPAVGSRQWASTCRHTVSFSWRGRGERKHKRRRRRDCCVDMRRWTVEWSADGGLTENDKWNTSCRRGRWDIPKTEGTDNRRWLDSKTDVRPELQQYHTFADELAVSGDFVFKGHKVVITLGYRQKMPLRLHCSHIGTNSCIGLAQ